MYTVILNINKHPTSYSVQKLPFFRYIDVILVMYRYIDVIKGSIHRRR